MSKNKHKPRTKARRAARALWCAWRFRPKCQADRVDGLYCKLHAQAIAQAQQAFPPLERTGDTMARKKQTPHPPEPRRGPAKLSPVNALKRAMAGLGTSACLHGVAGMLENLAGNEPDAEMHAGMVAFIESVRSVASGAASGTATGEQAADEAADEAALEALDVAFHAHGARACVRHVAAVVADKHAARLVDAADAFDAVFDAVTLREDGFDETAEMAAELAGPGDGDGEEDTEPYEGEDGDEDAGDEAADE